MYSQCRTEVVLSAKMQKLSWRQLVQNEKQYWLYRDVPSLLQLQPELQQKLLQLEQDAPPVVCSMKWVKGKSQQPCTRVRINSNMGVHYALLVYDKDKQMWQYRDLPESPWTEWAVTVLQTLVPVEPVSDTNGISAVKLSAQK